mgnify:CR=1 FL=1
MVKVTTELCEDQIEMGWKYISFSREKEKLVFLVEPMMNKEDIAYIPGDNAWKESAPYWAKDKKEEILSIMKSVPWNRRMQWIEDEDTLITAIPKEKSPLLKGTLETTEAGQEFLKLNLFDPGSEISFEQVHELWRVLEKRFAEQVRGEVTIYASTIVEGSVFEGVSLPVLMENKNAVLTIVGN